MKICGKSSFFCCVSFSSVTRRSSTSLFSTSSKIQSFVPETITTAVMSSFTDYVKSADEVVGYFCDVEGNLDYWERYLSISKVLQRVPVSLESVTLYQSHRGTILLKDNCHFVYGGDVCDRGKGDIRILSDLVNLKESYPDRVHFLLGNRDINKLRLPFTLHTAARDLLPWAYWIPKDPTASACSTISERMQWCLSKTMGSPISFESRREELQEMGLSTKDEDVANSYLKLVAPEGLLTKYIEQAKICVVLGDMIFVHGALHEHNYEWVPPSAKEVTNVTDAGSNADVGTTAMNRIKEGKLGWYCKDIRKWAAAVNAWKDGEILDYKQNYQSYCKVFVHGSSDVWDHEGGYNHPQPGSRLTQYGMGNIPHTKEQNPTVVYSSYLDMGKVIELESCVAEALTKAGLRTVVVGHQPQADAALILEKCGVQVISFDNSYSGFVQWPVDQLKDKNAWMHKDLTQTEHDKEAWKSYADYCKANSVTPVAVNEKGSETRSPIAIAGLYFLLPQPLLPLPQPSSPVDDGEVNKPLPSKVFIHGILTPGLTYAFELQPAGCSKYIGKIAKNGWYIKASGVRWANSEVTSASLHATMVASNLDCSTLADLPAKEEATVTRPAELATERGDDLLVSDSATLDAGNGPSAVYYLLSKSEGFTFRNKLVNERDIDKELV
jgi:hypothetical protein